MEMKRAREREECWFLYLSYSTLGICATKHRLESKEPKSIKGTCVEGARKRLVPELRDSIAGRETNVCNVYVVDGPCAYKPRIGS